MTATPAIQIDGLRKVFRLYPDLVGSRIKQGLFFWNTYYREKVALDDVDLRVEKGEVVGVIGPNGAGKTTLLKIIAGISYPTKGSVQVDGRVVAVLALGLGFHPRLTGLQNIELGCMMLGMTREEAAQKRDWIIEFSELGQYINSPMTSYSSGMRARLSFAVAACQEPEILIVDEALATGDVRFVQKCIDRIHTITRSGTTALFVSHNVWSIKRLTSRCILINDGKVVDDGDTTSVCDRYHEVMLKTETLGVEKADRDMDNFVGTGEVRLRSAQLLDGNASPAQLVSSGEPASLLLEFDAGAVPRHVGISLGLRRNDGISATNLVSMSGGVLNEKNEFSLPAFDLAAGVSKMRVTFAPLLLAPGDYSVDVQIYDPDNHSGFTSNQQYFFKTRVVEFGVRRIGNPNRAIVFYQPASVEVLPVGVDSAH